MAAGVYRVSAEVRDDRAALLEYRWPPHEMLQDICGIKSDVKEVPISLS